LLQQQEKSLRRFQDIGSMDKPKHSAPDGSRQQESEEVPEVPDPTAGERNVLNGGGDGALVINEAGRARVVLDRRAHLDRVVEELARLNAVPAGERDAQAQSRIDLLQQQEKSLRRFQDIGSMDKPKHSAPDGSRQQESEEVPEVPNPTAGERRVLTGSGDGALVISEAGRARVVLDRRAELERVEKRLADAEKALSERMRVARAIGEAAGAGFGAMPAAHGYVLYRGDAPIAPVAQFDQVRDRPGRSSIIVDPSVVGPSGMDLPATRGAAGALRAETGAIVVVRPPRPGSPIDLARLERDAAEILGDAGPGARVSIPVTAVNGIPSAGGQTVAVDAALRPVAQTHARTYHVFASPPPVPPVPYGLPRTPVPVPGQEGLHVLHGLAGQGAVQRADNLAQALRRPGMTTLVVTAAVDPDAGTVATAGGSVPLAEIDAMVAALAGPVSVVFTSPRAGHPSVAAALAQGHAIEVLVPGGPLAFDGTAVSLGANANWHQHSVVTGPRSLGPRLDQPPATLPTLTAAQLTALRAAGEAVPPAPVDGDGLFRSLLAVARDQIVAAMHRAGYQAVNTDMMRRFVAGWFATDFDSRPSHYLSFGITPERKIAVVRDLVQPGNTDGAAGHLAPLLAAMAFGLDLRVVNPDGSTARYGRVDDHGNAVAPPAKVAYAGSTAGPGYLPVLNSSDPAIGAAPAEQITPPEQWPDLTADPTVAPPRTDVPLVTVPTPDGSTAARYFTALPEGVSVAERLMNRRTVLILHNGSAPTVSDDAWPDGFATGGLSVYFDLGLTVSTARVAMGNLRPELAPKLTGQFLGTPRPVSGKEASAITTQVLGQVPGTAPVALHFPQKWITGPSTPSPYRIPVNRAGGHAFDSKADGFRYHPVNRPVPPRTRRIPGGWWFDLRESNVFSIQSQLAETYPLPDRTGDTVLPGTSGQVVIGRPGELVPQEVLDYVGRMTTPELNAEVVTLGRPLSERENAQLSTVRAALPDGWQASPVFNGWVLGTPGAPPPDLGPAASVPPLPGAKTIWIDPHGTNLREAVRAAMQLYGELPPAMQRRVVLQLVPGTKFGAPIYAALANRAGKARGGTGTGPVLIVPADDFTADGRPRAEQRNFVPMAWTGKGAVSALPQFADHYRVYPQGVTPAEPAPQGTAYAGNGRFDLTGPDLAGWYVDATNPDELTITHAGATWAPTPPRATADKRVKVIGSAGPATRAGLFELIDRWRDGRPLDIVVNGDRTGGWRLLENSAISEGLRQNPALQRAMPDGYQVIPLPAGQLIAPAGKLPDDLKAAQEMPVSPYATLLWLSGEVPVGAITAALPDSLRDRAVLHRGGDTALPDPLRGQLVQHEGKRAPRAASWVPTLVRQREFPPKPLAEEFGRDREQLERIRAVDRNRLHARRQAVNLTRLRARAEKSTGKKTPVPGPVAAPFDALRLANLGERDAAELRAARADIRAVDVQLRQLNQFLTEEGLQTKPVPIQPAGARGGSSAQHANAAVMEAIRLRLGGDAAGASAVIEANRDVLVKENNTNWVRWLRDVQQARPEWTDDVNALSEDVLRCR
jgi:hypothetical protein